MSAYTACYAAYSLHYKRDGGHSVSTASQEPDSSRYPVTGAASG